MSKHVFRRHSFSTRQTTDVICAMCGSEVRLPNDEPTDALRLEEDGRLCFDCPKCGHEYQLPYFNEDK